jgi:signal transduction histidine kinase
MDGLTRDLLDYSKPSPARLVPSKVDRILESAIFLTPLARRGSPFTIRKEFDPRLPEIRVDPQKVQQVFLNILLNSIQALGDSGEIAVRTSMQKAGAKQTVVVEITDNGVGMSADILEKAARPFFTTKQRGTGLGLSIAQQIMQGHGGWMQIESEPDKGTRFLLFFPM